MSATPEEIERVVLRYLREPWPIPCPCCKGKGAVETTEIGNAAEGRETVTTTIPCQRCDGTGTWGSARDAYP